MTTSIEYALMAGVAYRSTRDPVNRFPTPSEWSELQYRNLPDSGFEAVAFQKGSEIVISYSGTDPNNAGLFSEDMQTNGWLLNGDWATQLQQAAYPAPTREEA